MKSFAVVIYADRVLDDFLNVLTRRLSGTSLIQRSINLSRDLDIPINSIYILSGDEEVLLIAERNHIKKLSFDKKLDRLDNLKSNYEVLSKHDFIVSLSPFAPLTKPNSIKDASQYLLSQKELILQPVRIDSHKIYDNGETALKNEFINRNTRRHYVEFNGFSIFHTSILESSKAESFRVLKYKMSEGCSEIQSREDWWVSEKLLNRKKIIIRVIGDDYTGMGHIYRSLALANEIIDHEVIFVCTEDNNIAIDYLSKTNYLLKTFGSPKILQEIIGLKPDMIINDILDSSISDIEALKKSGALVVNFEDFGDGATATDLTINELFDIPQIESNNILWGREFYFLRDEFNDARPNILRKKLKTLLLTFGGTDPNNLSLPILKSISNFCHEKDITIKLVLGPGFQNTDKVKEFLETSNTEHIDFTNATGVISSIMEETDFAITSNGRTLYELAHMNIPAIVVAQNVQETTHKFSVLKNGFINVGEYDQSKTTKLVLENLKSVVSSNDFRKILFKRTEKFDFSNNKTRVLNTIFSLFNKEELL